MSDAYGGDLITITDPEGNDYELEHLDTIEMDKMCIRDRSTAGCGDLIITGPVLWIRHP